MEQRRLLVSCCLRSQGLLSGCSSSWRSNYSDSDGRLLVFQSCQSCRQPRRVPDDYPGLRDPRVVSALLPSNVDISVETRELAHASTLGYSGLTAISELPLISIIGAGAMVWCKFRVLSTTLRREGCTTINFAAATVR
jgi:hypothetical protein